MMRVLFSKQAFVFTFGNSVEFQVQSGLLSSSTSSTPSFSCLIVSPCFFLSIAPTRFFMLLILFCSSIFLSTLPYLSGITCCKLNLTHCFLPSGERVQLPEQSPKNYATSASGFCLAAWPFLLGIHPASYFGISLVVRYATSSTDVYSSNEWKGSEQKPK